MLHDEEVADVFVLDALVFEAAERVACFARKQNNRFDSLNVAFQLRHLDPTNNQER